MITLKLTTIGDSVGLILPPEVLEKLKSKEGDVLLVFETANGVEIRPYDAVLARQMEIAERVMDENRSVLQKLAGS